MVRAGLPLVRCWPRTVSGASGRGSGGPLSLICNVAPSYGVTQEAGGVGTNPVAPANFAQIPVRFSGIFVSG